jgi:hypothetical protein
MFMLMREKVVIFVISITIVHDGKSDPNQLDNNNTLYNLNSILQFSIVVKDSDISVTSVQ